MSAWGRRQSYPAVLGTTLVLTSVFVLTYLFKPLIPDPEPNPIVATRGSFMKGAAKQLVKWRSLSDQPFAEAKRLDKPLVLIVGSSWNTTARIFDRDVLSDVDIAERLNREFVPVRIDSTVRPEWEFGPLPLLGVSLGVEPGWYAVAIDPSGKLLSWMARADYQQILDTPTFQAWISTVASSRLSKPTKQQQELTKQYNLETQFLNGPTLPYKSDVSAYVNSVLAGAHSPRPFEVNGISTWSPEDWRLLIETGNIEFARKGLRTVLQSSNVDWLHGGLFRSDGNPGNGGTRFEKLYVQNAEMACVFAEIYVRTQDEAFRVMAEKTFDFVASRIIKSDQSYSFEYGDAGDLGRFPGISIRPTLLRRRFDPGDQSWLESRLLLNADKNLQMIPTVVDIDNYLKNREQYENYFKRIRGILPSYRPKFGGEDLANNLGFMTARLIESARVLQDEVRRKKISPILNRLRQFQIGGDSVTQSLEPSSNAIAFLGDYLGFADAMFQNFLATGNAADRDNGVRILSRATTLFIEPGTGVARSIPVERANPEAVWASFPNPIDGSQCSLVGSAIRLFQTGSIFNFGTKVGKDFRSVSEKMSAKFLPLTVKAPLRLGGVVRSSMEVTQDLGVMVASADPWLKAKALANRFPGVLIFPLTIRNPASTAIKEGVYIIKKGQLTGPFSDSDFSDQLSPSS